MIDINECAEDMNDCHRLAICTNTAGSFECDCIEGYSGSGVICSGKDILSFTFYLWLIKCQRYRWFFKQLDFSGTFSTVLFDVTYYDFNISRLLQIGPSFHSLIHARMLQDQCVLNRTWSQKVRYPYDFLGQHKA